MPRDESRGHKVGISQRVYNKNKNKKNKRQENGPMSRKRDPENLKDDVQEKHEKMTRIGMQWGGGKRKSKGDRLRQRAKRKKMQKRNMVSKKTKMKAKKQDFLKQIQYEVQKLSRELTKDEKYLDKVYEGAVEAICHTNRDAKWIVRFDDGYVTTIGEKKLKRMIIHFKSKKIGHQLDYIFVSRRWASCVTDCKV